jgi:drug/metabolite transporter (DMT)-like permease
MGASDAESNMEWLFEQPPPPRSCFNTFMGVLSVLTYVSCWVASTEIAQLILEGSHGAKYDKPMLLVWVVHSVMIIFIPVFYFGLKVQHSGFSTMSFSEYSSLEISKSFGSVKQAHKTAFILAIYYTVLNYWWSIAVPLTEATLANVIFQSQSAFAFAFALLFLGEHFSWLKVVPLVVCLLGVVLTAVSRSSSSSHAVRGPFFTCESPRTCEIVGNVLMIAVAAGYGLYEVLYKRLVGSLSPLMSL